MTLWGGAISEAHSPDLLTKVLRAVSNFSSSFWLFLLEHCFFIFVLIFVLGVLSFFYN